MKRRTFLLGLSAVSLSFPARADDVDATLAEITKARAGVRSLVAPFEQERTIGLLATTVKSKGEMTLVRPDRLRWELEPPDAVVYWIGPEGLAYATPGGGGSVGKSAAGRFGAVLGDLMTLLGGDLAKLRARYDLSVQRAGGGVVLGARPTADDVKKHVKTLTLGLAPDLWAPQRIEIEESNGDRSTVTFGKVARDVKIDPARMQPPRR
jgi:outer membrane lipoprotein-sorting protein